MRFVYCACCVSYILNDWSAINVDLTADYIKKSLVHLEYFKSAIVSPFFLSLSLPLSFKAYNFGFGQGPFLESHGE